MAKAPYVARKRGRPTAEEAAAIAAEKAMLSYKLDMIALLPDAVQTLKGLLQNGTEKVKEGTSKFIINETKEIFGHYIEEENETDAAGGSTSASSETHAGQQSEMRKLIPLTTEIREYELPKAEGED